MEKLIKLIDGVCGSGKTHTYLQYIQANSSAQKFIVAAVTGNLVNEIEHKLKAQYEVPGVVSLLSEHGNHVGSDLLRMLNPDSNCQVIVVTHKALEDLGRKTLIDTTVRKYLHDVTVIVDEAPSPIMGANFPVEAKGNIKWIEFTREEQGVRGGNKTGGYLWAENQEKIISCYKEPSNSIAVSAALWIMATGYPLIKTRESSKGFHLAGYCHSPILEVFKHSRDFYLVSSNAKASPFVVVANEWCNIRSELAPEYLQPSPDRNSHDSTRVTCAYAVDGRASLSALAKNGDYAEVCKIVNSVLKSGFLFATNNDKRNGGINYEFAAVADEAFRGVGVRVPYSAHGLNIYGGEDVHGYSAEELELLGYGNDPRFVEGFRKAAWLGVARLNNELISHLEEISAIRGGDGKAVVAAIEVFASFEPAYQMVLRTVLRDINSTERVCFVFIDEATMNYFIETYAPSARVIRIETIKIKGKGDSTKEDIQFYKSQGYDKSQVAEKIGKSISTVYAHWG